MDRFIAYIIMWIILLIMSLKSNMDRFIGVAFATSVTVEKV